jgi:hypothetical protein
MLRLGRYLGRAGDARAGRYERAGLAIARTLMGEPYLSADARHEGLLLHAVYHRPNGWDAAPDPDGVPRGESCMWGDYHLLELALYLWRIAKGREPQRFFTLGQTGRL